MLPGPIKLHSKAATVYKRAMDDKFQSDRGIGSLSAYALAASEENGRGHLVITAPTGGSAGVMPALVYGLSRSARSTAEVPTDACRGGNRLPLQTPCDSVGGRRRLPGGNWRRVSDGGRIDRDRVRRTSGSSKTPPSRHWSITSGMTCDPVAGYVQVPCIERCAFGAVKAWTAYAIASNEIAPGTASISTQRS